MRKIYVAILLFAFISGCEKSFDDVVDIAASGYQVTGTNVYTSNTFKYVVGDSLITIYLSLNSSDGVASVFCDVIASDETKLNSDPFYLLDNGSSVSGDERAGDSRFTNKFPLSRQNPIGTYKINYFITDKKNVTKLVAEQQFIYDNGQDKVPPIVTNLVMPDTIKAGETIFFSIEVTDDNGLSDIELVFYETYNPDGVKVVNSKGISQFPMFDDGNTDENGDVTSGDGIYSVLLTFPATTLKGTWRFVFNAKDRGSLISNTIEKSIVVE